MLLASLNLKITASNLFAALWLKKARLVLSPRMGLGQSAPPKVVEDEKAKWAVDHSLRINNEIRDRQLDFLHSFGDILYLCSTRCSQNSLEFQHYFVTDGLWTMEFLSSGLQVHQNTLPQPCDEHARFTRTKEVECRLRQVCGATAYSVTLRNGEHLARYIYSGTWISHQMSGESSSLGATFAHIMMDEHLRKLNRLPVEIQEYARGTPIYSPKEYPGFLHYLESPQGLSKADHSEFNVLVVGPAGCGKSRLINLLFNRNVAESRGSAASVTRELHIYSGTGLINDSQKKVNIIDTIGLCDTYIPDGQVLQLIKDSMKVNFAYVDQVVVICAGRIETNHTEAIGRIIDWLRFSSYECQFTFIYNKVDQMEIPEREPSAKAMLALLGVESTMLARGTPRNGDRVRFPLGAPMCEMPPQIPKCIMTGFPKAEFEVLRSDLAMAVDSIFAAPKEGQRIPVHESWSSIL
eukprot:s620_g4.t1